MYLSELFVQRHKSDTLLKMEEWYQAWPVFVVVNISTWKITYSNTAQSGEAGVRDGDQEWREVSQCVLCIMEIESNKLSRQCSVARSRITRIQQPTLVIISYALNPGSQQPTHWLTQRWFKGETTIFTVNGLMACTMMISLPTLEYETHKD